MNKRTVQFMVSTLFASILAGCATATVIPVGNTRPPVDPAQVRLYVSPPPHYEVLGLINGNSNYEGTSQSGIADMVRKIKEQAAKIGANGVLLGKMAEQYLGSSGGATYMGWGIFNSASMAAYSQTMQAEAIYVSMDGSMATTPGQQIEHGAWPLQLPQLAIRTNCEASMPGNVETCINVENAAHAWLLTHTTTVQIAGDCTAFSQESQSYAMIKACVQQREQQGVSAQ